jgi:hypothetical protein
MAKRQDEVLIYVEPGSAGRTNLRAIDWSALCERLLPQIIESN